MLKRRKARSSLLDFTLFTKPDYNVGWHHRLLCDYLDRFVSGEIKRLMVFMPPRHGKSELVSRRLPAFIFGNQPDANIIACSYSADLASRMNRDVQRIIETPIYGRIFPETKLFGANVRTVSQGAYLRNSDIFEIVDHAGSYRSAGVGGGITGMGFNYGIIDDPVKSRKEAESSVFRDAVWEWYTSDFYTRQEGGAGILLTTTRWHEDDLAGRLLKQVGDDGGGGADDWVIVNLPALYEREGAIPQDKRGDGEALWPWKYDTNRLHKIKAVLGSYQWLGLYQQRPTAREGNRFKRHWFKVVNAAPAEARRVRYWDKAGTSGGGKFTAGVLMARGVNGRYCVEDVVRGQWSAHEREKVIKQTAELDAAKYGQTGVAIWHEQEPGSGGKESAENTNLLLAGYNVHSDIVSGDKDTRMTPFEAQCEAGNVDVVSGPWVAAYLDELCAIPNGAYRDQADGSSGAFNKLLKPVPEIRVRSL